MDRRFSTIFTEAFLPLPPNTPKQKPNLSELASFSQPAPAFTQFIKESRTSRLKRFVRAILPTSPSTPRRPKSKVTAEELGQHLWGTVVHGSTKPSKKTAQKLKKDGRKTSQGAVIVLSPAPATLPSFRRRDIFTRGLRSGESGRDSKFSSISSFEALQPAIPTHCPSATSINLSVHEYERLQSLIRRVKRGLMKQEYLTGHLSKNLVQLLGRKERQITYLRDIRRIRREDREAMQRAIFLGREHAGRIFLRKSVFLQRSQSVLAQLNDMVESNTSSVGDGIVEIRVSPETVHDFVLSLQSDLKFQQRLNQDLIAMVKKSCGERRFMASVNDKILTERFIQFVDKRLSVLGACYESTGSSVQKIDSLRYRSDDLESIS